MPNGVNWPSGFDRTPSDERDRTSKYRVTIHDAVSKLKEEMDRLDVDDWRLETNLDHQKKKPNYPYSRQKHADDPSVVVRWTMDDGQYAVACDRYTTVRDNIRTLGLYIREKRKMRDRPVVTGESEFANAALPPGDETDTAGNGAVVATPEPPHEVLGVQPDAPDSVVKAAARRLKADHHPDNGGDKDEYIRVTKAEERLLSEADA